MGEPRNTTPAQAMEGRRVKSLAPSSPDPQSQIFPPPLAERSTTASGAPGSTCSPSVGSATTTASCTRCTEPIERRTGRGRPRLYCDACRVAVDREHRRATRLGVPVARCRTCGAPLNLAPGQEVRDRCLKCAPPKAAPAPRLCERCSAPATAPRGRLCDGCRQAAMDRRRSRDRARRRPPKGRDAE
jgi:hypothetical protein